MVHVLSALCLAVRDKDLLERDCHVHVLVSRVEECDDLVAVGERFTPNLYLTHAATPSLSFSGPWLGAVRIGGSPVNDVEDRAATTEALMGSLESSQLHLVLNGLSQLRDCRGAVHYAQRASDLEKESSMPLVTRHKLVMETPQKYTSYSFQLQKE